MALQSEDDDEDIGETSMVTNVSILSRLSPRGKSLMGPSKFNVFVQFLDRTERHCSEYKKSAPGQHVLDDICKFLNIAEKEFFGLQYEDNKFRYWLDLSKPLSKQFHRKLLEFRLRFRFYPSDPSCLREEVTRYQLFLQICRDLLHGRLSCTQNEAATLCGLILQASEGDFNEDIMGNDADYVSGYQLIIKQSQKIEEKIAEAHKTFRGLSTEEAETEFLNIACKMETYGFNPHVVKNASQTEEVVIGATSHGILIYVRGQRTHSFKWSEINKVDYIGKELIITPSKEYIASVIRHSLVDNDDSHNLSLNSSFFNSSGHSEKSKEKKKQQLKLVCPSATYAKNLWRDILSQQAFFTEDRATDVKPKVSKARIPLFSRGSTFRCPTPRVLHELEFDASPPRSAAEKTFERQPLKKYTPRSVEESWNLNKSISGHSTLERPARNHANNVTFNSSGGSLLAPAVNELLSTNNSAMPIAEEICDVNPQSLVDNIEQAGNEKAVDKICLDHNTHPEDVGEKMTNGGFTLFGRNFSRTSLKNGTTNGTLASNHNEHDKQSKENHSPVVRTSLVIGVILLMAFFAIFFFFPELLTSAATHFQQLSSQVKIPPWLMPKSSEPK